MCGALVQYQILKEATGQQALKISSSPSSSDVIGMERYHP